MSSEEPVKIIFDVRPNMVIIGRDYGAGYYDSQTDMTGGYYTALDIDEILNLKFISNRLNLQKTVCLSIRVSLSVVG